MFLYIPDERALDAVPGKNLGFISTAASRTVNYKGQRLIWTEDAFTEFVEGAGQIVIQIRRPGIDSEPLVKLVWRYSSGEVRVDRRWSGEFSVYFAERPAPVVASHLRLIA